MAFIEPALCRVLKVRVVVALRLINELLEADIAADAVTRAIEQVGRDEPGDSTVAVAKWVDAEEIENECGRDDQRVLFAPQREQANLARTDTVVGPSGNPTSWLSGTVATIARGWWGESPMRSASTLTHRTSGPQVLACGMGTPVDPEVKT